MGSLISASDCTCSERSLMSAHAGSHADVTSEHDAAASGPSLFKMGGANTIPGQTNLLGNTDSTSSGCQVLMCFLFTAPFQIQMFAWSLLLNAVPQVAAL